MTKKKNLLTIVLTGVLFATATSCNNPNTNSSGNTPDTLAIEETVVEQPASGTEQYQNFDWSKVPQSSSSIGVFPYMTAPDGFFIVDKGGWNETKTGYSELLDFYKLIIFNGQSFYNAEGKVAKLKFSMKEKNAEWNQYKFDSSVEKYLVGIGAKLIGKLKVNEEQKAFLNKDDDMAIYNHIIGDPRNEPVRFYALNHAKGKIMFQVFSNSASGEIAVIELAAFEQTIKAPTASEMKKEMDANGKAILNINFETDKATLQPDGKKVVDEILLLMKENATLKIAIEGHTDNAGAADRNKKLATERANTILKYLTINGIATSRLTAAGFGAERPLVANDTKENMAKNRRVELIKK